MSPSLVFMLRYFWLVAMFLSVLNAVIIWARCRSHMERDPSLRPGYVRMFRWFLVAGNIPWIVMGLGVLVGGEPTVFSFLHPRSGDPWAIAFVVTLYALWGLLFYWVVIGDGAAQLAQHPGFFTPQIRSAVVIKVFVAVLIGIVATGFTVMLLGNLFPYLGP